MAGKKGTKKSTKKSGPARRLDWPAILAEVDAGTAVSALAAREGITTAAIYRQLKRRRDGEFYGLPGRRRKIQGDTTRITVRLPVATVEAAQREASALDVTESDLYRETLVQRFGPVEEAATKNLRPRPPRK